MRGFSSKQAGFLLFTLVAAVLAAAQQAEGPKYPPCRAKACDQDLSHDPGHPTTKNGCTGWCADAPLRVTPTPIEACEGEYIAHVRVRLENGTLDKAGNNITAHEGQMDWDDGTTPTPIFVPGAGFDQNITHTYVAARTYYPSAYYREQYAYSGDGSCSYSCRVQQASVAIVYSKTSPECASGKFQPTAESRKHKMEEMSKFHALVKEPPK
jgi:hypothetical protein